MKWLRGRVGTKAKQLTLVLTLAFGLLLGGSAVAPQPASASAWDCNWMYDAGRWHCVPEFCYYPTYMVQWFGYPNQRTCVMNHLGYAGYYP